MPQIEPDNDHRRDRYPRSNSLNSKTAAGSSPTSRSTENRRPRTIRSMTFPGASLHVSPGPAANPGGLAAILLGRARLLNLASYIHLHRCDVHLRLPLRLGVLGHRLGSAFACPGNHFRVGELSLQNQWDGARASFGWFDSAALPNPSARFGP